MPYLSGMIKIKRPYALLTLLLLSAITFCLANPNFIIKTHKLIYVKYVRIFKSDFSSRFNSQKLNIAIAHAKNAAWVQKQIAIDLAPFKEGISKQQLNTWFKDLQHPTENKLAKFIVQDEILQTEVDAELAKSRAYKTVYSVIDLLVKQKQIPDCEFIVALNDYLAYVPSNIKDPAAIFTFAKHTQIPVENTTIMIPDWMNVRYWDVLRNRIDLANRLFPWNKKQNVIHWRGGKADSMQHRNKLVNLNDKFNFLDVGFTEGTNPAQFVDPEFSIKYKYQIALDGSRCTWERMVWQMYSNTVLIKPASPQQQWYHGALKPYHNYLPVTDINEEELASAYDWLQKNDAEAKMLVKNANKFARDNFKTEDFFAYYAVLLQEYAKLLRS